MPAFDSYSTLAGASIASGDKFILKDASGGVVNMTAEELLQAISTLLTAGTALTGSGVHATQDHIFISDNGVAKKILVTEVAAAMIALGSAITSGYHATEDHFLYSDNGVLKKVTVANAMAALLSLTTTPVIGDSTAAALVDEANAINTTGKYAGKWIADLTNNELYRAADATVNGVWENFSGGSDITPAA